MHVQVLTTLATHLVDMTDLDGRNLCNHPFIPVHKARDTGDDVEVDIQLLGFLEGWSQMMDFSQILKMN